MIWNALHAVLWCRLAVTRKWHMLGLGMPISEWGRHIKQRSLMRV